MSIILTLIAALILPSMSFAQNKVMSEKEIVEFFEETGEIKSVSVSKNDQAEFLGYLENNSNIVNSISNDSISLDKQNTEINRFDINFNGTTESMLIIDATLENSDESIQALYDYNTNELLGFVHNVKTNDLISTKAYGTDGEILEQYEVTEEELAESEAQVQEELSNDIQGSEMQLSSDRGW